jgi:hypothetical protein
MSANNAIISIFTLGLNLAFDRRTLIDYSASRSYTIRIFLIANKLASAVAKVKSVFTPNFAFAPIAA